MRMKRGTKVLWKVAGLVAIIIIAISGFNLVQYVSTVLVATSHNVIFNLFVVILCYILVIALIVGALIVKDLIEDIRKILNR